jgi:S-adenosylhomocysteine hydrolase
MDARYALAVSRLRHRLDEMIDEEQLDQCGQVLDALRSMVREYDSALFYAHIQREAREG